MSKRAEFRLSFNVVDKGGVRGRSKEITTLKKLYRDCAQVSKVLIVEGKAGVGKTALIRSQHNQFCGDGHFVSGTFDQQRKSEPFSAIVDALHELFDELLGEEFSLDENSVVKEIMDQFSAESKNDAGMRSVLQNAFPMFVDLVQAKRDESRLQQEAFDMSGHSWALKKSTRKRQVTEKRTSTRTEGGGRKGWNFEKLKISLRLLLKCICNAKRRVVIFLDDLHYADPSSLELIEFLASGDGLSPIPSKVDEDSPVDQVKGLMLVLAYRNAASDASKSDAITIDHPFRVRLKELKLLKCPIHRIHVKDLELEAVNEIVSHVTHYSDKPDTTMPLSEVIFKKTGGNAFSVLNMLEFLEHEKLLFFSMNDYKWKWKNVRTIHSATDLSDSVADMVALKLKNMPPATQQILMVASCLGSYFRLEVVAAYFRKHNAEFHKVDFETAVQEALANGEAAEEEEEEEKKDGNGSAESRRVSLDANGKPKSTLLDRMIKLLELPLRQDLLTKKRKSTTYFFAHKQLQTAAYALIKGGDKARKELHWRLGQLMKYKSQQFPEEHWMAYLACDQLNRGLISLSSEERLELAQMNLQIAMMSQEKSAFVPAAEFLRSAILLLFQEEGTIQDPTPKGGSPKGSPTKANPSPASSKLYSCSPTQYKAVWKECYDICVDMFSSLAEMEYLLGNHKASKQAVDEVLKNAHTEEDKFRAQVILIESISAQRNFDAAIDTCLKILAAAYDMKLSASPMKLQIMNEKKKVNRMLEQQIQSDSDDKSRGEMSASFSNDGSLSSSQTSVGATRSTPVLPAASSRQGPISRMKSTPVVSQATKPAGAMSRIKSTTRTSLLPKNVMPKNDGRRAPSIMPKNGGRFQKAAASESSRITRMFQKKQEQAMMTLPKMTDDQHIRTSKLLSQLMLNAILSGKTELSAYIGLRSIRFSFQHGISPHSPMALAAYGISQAKEGKYNDAYANGMLALKLLDIAESKDWYTRTILKCHNLRQIKKPFHESLDPMMEGYRTGVESGDMEYALVAAMHYALLYMFVGLPLAPLEPDLMAFAEQVHRYHLPFVLEVTFYIYRGYVLELQGEENDEMVFKDDDEAKSSGDLSVSSSTGINEVYVDKRVRPLVEREMCIVKMQKFYLFGQYEEAEKMMNQLSELPAFDYSVLRTINREAFFGLINLALAKTTGKKRFRERASKIIDEFKVYVRHGSVNSHHILLLLQAEEASVNATEWESVVKSYDECISNAARSGFTNHEALGNELAGLFLHEMRKTNKKARSDNVVAEQYQNYISRAMALYTEWGAKAKVEQLEKQFPQLRPSNLLQGANVKARRRFSRTLTARFRDMKLHSGRWSVGASSDLKILDGFDDLKNTGDPDPDDEDSGRKIDPYGFAAGSKRF